MTTLRAQSFAANAARSSNASYTGRERELTTLHACLEKALAGQGQFITVTGEAGVGKSRLLYEFRHLLDREQVTVMQGWCHASGSMTSYLPFLDALRRGLGLQDEDTPAALLEKAVANITAIDSSLEQYLLLHRKPGAREKERRMTTQGRGLLAVWTDIPAAVEEDFNRWYNEEHIPERVGIPGFLNGRRYLSLTGTPQYMALYSTVDAQVLQSETYLKVLANATAWTQKVRPHFQNFVRNEYELLLDLGTAPDQAAPYVLTVRLDIGPEHDDEFNDWYNTDHLPALAGVPGVYRAQRYRATAGAPRYLAVYELTNGALLQGDAWKTAAHSPWTQRMRRLYKDLTAHVGQLIMARP